MRDNRLKNEFINNFSKEIATALKFINIGVLIENTHGEESNDLLTVDIGPIEIPQYPVFDVKETERVIISVKDNELPCVFCRQDFDIVPHLNIGYNGVKSLCLFDVSFNDIKHEFNAVMFLYRILLWFQKTARNELHQEGQTLEPFFQYSEDFIILDHYERKPLRHFIISENYGIKLLRETANKSSSDISYFSLNIDIQESFDRNIINKLPANLEELQEMFDYNIVERMETHIYDILRIKSIPEVYKDVFDQKDTEFRKTKLMIILSVGLKRRESSKEEYRDYRAFIFDISFGGLIKALGYTVKDNKIISKNKNNDYKRIRLIPYNIMHPLTQERAVIFNGEQQLNYNKTFIQIGLGTLGSQIANNCVRTGYGKWTYVDNDLLLPHNVARHCLKSNDIGQNKAYAMKKYASQIIECNDSVLASIEKSIFDKDIVDINEKVKNADMIVDTSASVSAGRYICHSIANNTRCVSLFMNPSGTALVMLLENADRSIKLDSLEMQYYRMILYEDNLKSHLERKESFSYSSQCRSSSVVFSQDNVAILSGLASKALKNFEKDPMAQICVWNIEDFSVKKYKEAGEIFDVFVVGEWKVQISRRLQEELYQLRKDKLPNETGGILIGNFDFERKICYVVDHISNISDSVEYPQSFIRGSNGVINRIEKIEKVTAGNLMYLGEWHSHPNNITNQSLDDIKLMEAIIEYNLKQGYPACMLIVGGDNQSVFIKW